jgi:hypothetical protein
MKSLWGGLAHSRIFACEMEYNSLVLPVCDLALHRTPAAAENCALCYTPADLNFWNSGVLNRNHFLMSMLRILLSKWQTRFRIWRETVREERKRARENSKRQAEDDAQWDYFPVSNLVRDPDADVAFHTFLLKSADEKKDAKISVRGPDNGTDTYDVGIISVDIAPRIPREATKKP